ncbi:cryptochrome/photolyase family protein [Caenispirillum salinarum]|uniref:cryptochrome/photolyase family protein n=1 Tax=Caenispirillum salinarum TaxID=859058 RepID=UPI00384BEF58
MPSSASPVIVLFRDDLRLADHPALAAAASSGAPVIPLYVVDTNQGLGAGETARPLGGALKWWLHYSLESLDESLRAVGSRLILRSGRPHEVVPQLAAETGAARVLLNDTVVPAHRESARLMATALKDQGVETEALRPDALVWPTQLRTGTGGHYKVYTPFWKALKQAVGEPETLPPPERLAAPNHWPDSTPLADACLTPSRPDWAGGLRESWTPGEDGAWTCLHTFIDGALARYRTGRNLPAEVGTSRLSPHLRFGEISARQVWNAVRSMVEPNASTDAYLGEIGWREFNRYQLFHNPDLHRTPLRPEFRLFPWREDDADIRAWRKGLTGYPVVDAGMRELWETGWMHNRVRMIVGSFLVKDLLAPWQVGEEWFWDTLVDADWGSNPGNWQWVAGCGADAAPFFRVFNPVLQGEKFDPRGDYVRRWVPELRGMDRRVIHKPWQAPLELARTGYPEPMVDHSHARHRALAAWRGIKDAAE